MSEEIPTKKCTKCGESKPLDGFTRSKTGRHGRHAWCKVCKSEIDKAYNKENSESIKSKKAENMPIERMNKKKKTRTETQNTTRIIAKY